MKETISKGSVQRLTNCAIYAKKKYHFAAVRKTWTNVSQYRNNVKKVNEVNSSEINLLYVDNILIEVGIVNSTEKEWYKTITVQDQHVNFTLGSGAQINILPK